MTDKLKPGQHMGVRALTDVLMLITQAPMTARQVSERHPCHQYAVSKALRVMVQLGIAHVSGWDQTTGGTPAAVFSGGAGVNVPQPITKAGHQPKTAWGRGTKVRPPATVILFASLIKVLEEGGTIADLAEKTGASPNTAHTFANHAHAIGLCHIGAWVHGSMGYPARVFMLGEGRDARRPKAQCPNKKALRYYHARKAKERQMAVTSALAGIAQPFLEAA